MSKALSLHIGLNHVNPDAYDGWDGELSGCINDANSMKRIADTQGFTSATLIDNQATCAAVTNKICDIGRQLDNGDFFLLTYSGHGGQLVDNTGEETDGLNETWVLWDRQFIDNEIYNLLSQFKSGVRIFVSSDSCHSGTVIRAFLRQLMKMKTGDQINYHTEFNKFLNTASREIPQNRLREVNNSFENGLKKRAMPEAQAIQNYEKNKEVYDAARNMAGTKDKARAAMCAGVIYISGCADNQSSYDGDVNGAFTTSLLAIWNNGSFSGTYPNFHTQIRDHVNNPSQVPEYMKLGPVTAGYENSKPYTINTGSTGTGGSTNGTTTGAVSQPDRPSMSASPTYNRQGSAPVFQINKGSNPYYYVELATDKNLFTYNNTARNSNNWFATWGNRFTAATYQIPDSVWNAMKNAERIYYRIGTTSSQAPGWNDLKVSFFDSENTNAPYITLQDTSAGSGNGSGSTSSGSIMSTTNSISESVGSGGNNRAGDVRTIQQLLNEIRDSDGGSAAIPLSVDGDCGSNTIAAIRRFQTKQEFTVSGLIKSNSSLLHMLLNKSGRAQ
ncbi:MAG: caspase family protein [Chitinophagaceae bacterium]